VKEQVGTGWLGVQEQVGAGWLGVQVHLQAIVGTWGDRLVRCT
jgi:hypothetical protein